MNVLLVHAVPFLTHTGRGLLSAHPASQTHTAHGTSRLGCVGPSAKTKCVSGEWLLGNEAKYKPVLWRAVYANTSSFSHSPACWQKLQNKKRRTTPQKMFTSHLSPSNTFLSLSLLAKCSVRYLFCFFAQKQTCIVPVCVRVSSCSVTESWTYLFHSYGPTFLRYLSKEQRFPSRATTCYL